MFFLKKFLPLLVILALVPIISVKADGGLVPPRDKVIGEVSQNAIIVFDGEKEDLHLLIEYYGDTENFSWIIPTPAMPTIETSSSDYFDSLYYRTYSYENYSNYDLGYDVTVHDRDMVSYYDVSVISGDNVNRIVDWLVDNDYQVNSEIKDALEYYVGRGWYFVAVRIDPEKIIEEAVDKFLDFNNTVNNTNFIERVQFYLIQSLEENSYEMYQNIDEVLTMFDSKMSGLDKDEFSSLADDLNGMTEENRYEFDYNVIATISGEVATYNGRNVFNYCLDSYREYNQIINEDNFSEVLTNDLVEGMINKDYELFKPAFETISIFMADANNMDVVASKQNFLAEISDLDEMIAEMGVGQFKTFMRIMLNERINSTMNGYFKESAKAILADYYPNKDKDDYAGLIIGDMIESFRDVDYDKFANVMNLIISLSYDESDLTRSLLGLSKELFESAVQETSDYSDEDWQKIREEGVVEYEMLIDAIYESRFKGEITPLKISFATEQMVYPLRISKFSAYEDSQDTSAKTTVNIYVIADQPVKATGLKKQYGDWIESDFEDSLNEGGGIYDIIDGRKYLTQLRGEYSKDEMNQDIYFSFDELMEDNNDEALNIKEPVREVASYDPVFVVPTNDREEGPFEVAPIEGIVEKMAQPKAIKITDEMHQKLKGMIIIRAEANGEAYYIDLDEPIAYYLARPADAFSILRSKGVGISNKDLNNIPYDFFSVEGKDSDYDGLADKFEEAIGTDKYNIDTDGDGKPDIQEVVNGYNPLVKGQKMQEDAGFANKSKGSIYIQVEGSGEAWYVYPVNGRRYYLGSPEDAFKVMQSISLGVTEDDFNKMVIN